MELTPPQTRKCEECSNTITLNLFRLNSEKCRYCEDGLEIPKRLLSFDTFQADEAKSDQEPIQIVESQKEEESSVKSDLMSNDNDIEEKHKTQQENLADDDNRSNE